ncbi:NAD(P)/FAD-dependent oxidoreductase [Bordetella bronchialis]|uniref:FAD-dependent oxidoreductase n=1 Tax=Bordetella bronchialis TaxID=463025 RepID=A0ABN4R7S8_9BORD|nr:FAD-dependent oxidoreductase [Bordetella bronchialis]ANN69147.1 FAD-dependent oxidoreductase [Bordetella bronchialis]
MMECLHTEVAIIGGGIVGASAALFLRRRGVPVVLLDAAACGAKASGVNYGGVRRQGRPLAQMPLTRRAHALWGDLRGLIGTDGEYQRSGHLKLAYSQADLAELEHYRASTRGYGMHLEMLDRPALERRFPWLGNSVVGGSFCPEDGHANPRLVSPAFAQAARRAGATVRESTRVDSALHDGAGFVLRAGDTLEVRARMLLNCAGAWAGHFAAAFGEAVPETSIHPLMMVTEPLPRFMTASLGVQGGGVYARQVDRGNCVIGGGRGVSASPDFARPGRAQIGALLAKAADLLPSLRTAHVIRFWSGVEGNMPDHNPVLGPSGTTPGLFHAFGFSGAGFQIGPAAGEVLADLAATGRTDIPIDAFRIDRYAAGAHAAAQRTDLGHGHTLEST